MQTIKTPIEGLLILEPKIFGDERGYFFESYNKSKLPEAIRQIDFIQDNEAFSGQSGVLRGLHYQIPPYDQSKLVRVVQGEVFDVVVDIRPDSTTYGQWFGVYLSAENKRQFFVPKGFAHGYVVLSESATFCYKCDNYYSKDHEGGIIYNDPQLNIDWAIEKTKMQLSEKDEILPTFGSHRKFEEEINA